MKKLLTLVLALMMVLSLSATALAAGEGEGTVQQDPPQTGETLTGVNGDGSGQSNDGHTTIGIVSTTATTTVNPDGSIDAPQLEFEVPLYVVLAVGSNLVDGSGNSIITGQMGAAGEGGVVCPSEAYVIKGTNDAAKIGVRTMNFSSIGTWRTVAVTATKPNATKAMQLKVGENMPAVAPSANATLYSSALSATEIGAITGTKSVFSTTSPFYKNTAAVQGPAAIGTAGLTLDLQARVDETKVANQAATREFKIVYTIGLVNEGTGTTANSFVDAALFTYLGSDLATSKLG